MISSHTKKAAVIGDPISHSLSPKIHNYLIKKYKIDGIYLPYRVVKADLENTITEFSEHNFCGFNVTLPHKETILQFCHHLSKTAKKVGAVNTVIITPDKKLFGHNSDGEGFIQNILQNSKDFNFANKNIVILGAGGATRAILFALLNKGIKKVTICNRNRERALKLIADFQDNFKKIEFKFLDFDKKEQSLEGCDLLINCTSLGMQGQPELEIDLHKLAKNAIVSDIVYKPLITNLLQKSQDQGHQIVTGIGMLINQALVGFEAWYGIKPEIDQELINQLLQA